MALTTADIGLAIRDFLDDRSVLHFDGECERHDDEENAVDIEFIDASDANNLTICCANGQTFKVRIFAS